MLERMEKLLCQWKVNINTIMEMETYEANKLWHLLQLPPSTPLERNKQDGSNTRYVWTDEEAATFLNWAQETTSLSSQQ